MDVPSGPTASAPSLAARRVRALSSAALCLLTLAPGPTRGLRVSHALAPGEGVGRFFAADPLGARVLYGVQSFAGDHGQVFAANSDGSGDVLPLTDVMAGVHAGSFVLGPDRQRIAFASTQDPPGRYQLYSAPTDGSQPPVRISHTLGPSEFVSPYFRFTSNGARVVYLAQGKLYSAPADGSQPAQPLTSLTIGGLFQMAHGDRVVFSSGDYYSVPADGSAAPTRLTPPVVNLQPTSEFQVSPNGERLVYRALEFSSGSDDSSSWVFSVPVDGSLPPVPLFDPVFAGEFPASPSIRISPDSAWVVHRSAPEGPPRVIESAPIDGSAPAELLHPPYSAGGSVSDFFRITEDGSVVFGHQPDAGTSFGLYVTPVDRSTTALRITPTAGFPRAFKWEVSAQSRVVFVAGSTELELYSVPLDGSELPIRLSPPMVANGDVYLLGNDEIPSFRIHPGGAGVLYTADQETDETYELFYVPTDGSARARKMNLRLPAEGDVIHYEFAADGKRTLYLADQLTNDQFELFTSHLEELVSFEVVSPLTPGRGTRP